MDNKKKNNEIPLTDLDYEGVIYEPSKEAKRLTKNKINKKEKTKKDVYPKQKIKKAQDFNFNIFIGVTSVIGVIIFFVVAGMTYSYISPYFAPKNTAQETTLNLSDGQNKNDIVINPDTEVNLVGFIKDINYDTSVFNIVSIKDNKIYTLKSKQSTVFKDKYDNMLTVQEIQVGDIVDFAFDEDNNLNYIKENANCFTLDNISKVQIDLETMTLAINSKKYNIYTEYICLKDGLPFPIEKISKLDVLTLKGYEDNIYFLDVKKGNGVLKLINKPNLKNAVIEIDRDIFKSLDEVETIDLSEGKHKVVIRSDDTMSFVKEINIIAGTENILDLSQIQNKSGTLLINSDVSDYTLYVNNEKKPTNEPLTLMYGVYSIRAEKEGYNPFQKQISIEQPQTSLNITLEKIEKVGKMSLTSTPDNAEVFVDNIFVGYTPLNYKLAQGVHTVTLKKDGYNDFVLSSITIGDEESSFNITMHKLETQTTTSTTETTTQQ